MKFQRRRAALSLLAGSGLLLSACGSDTGGGAGSSPNPSTNPGGAVAITCSSGSLTAAGSTAQQNAIAQWIKDYLNKCSGANINYGGGGSGQGVQQFTDAKIDFAGSDFPLAEGKEQQAADARCKSGPAINIPMVGGPIAIGYNVPGMTKNLNLSASNLAKIFSGKITNWNDPAIAQDNPGTQLPSLGIQSFHRSDGSGTTYNFTNYLANDAKADWTFGTAKNWTAPGGQGAKGSQGVAQGVKSTPGGIGYFELSFATQSQIPYAMVGNAEGKFIPLTQENAVNFLSKAKVVGTGGDLKLQFDYTTTDAAAYPNLLVTYEIVCSKGNAADKLPLLKNFLGYAASPAGQQELPGQGYISLPANLQQQVRQTIDSLG
ncbi:MAG: phosphate ABC transporter substrate-binding protein PstS [Pseudonocardiales bacterium]|nr:phosphate ABC transporter substrate-binding protein PstS [Pseudonocardiales bacterium]